MLILVAAGLLLRVNGDLAFTPAGEELAKSIELPAGVTMNFDNAQVEVDEALRSLFVSLAISILLIYLLLPSTRKMLEAWNLKG